METRCDHHSGKKGTGSEAAFSPAPGMSNHCLFPKAEDKACQNSDLWSSEFEVIHRHTNQLSACPETTKKIKVCFCERILHESCCISGIMITIPTNNFWHKMTSGNYIQMKELFAGSHTTLSNIHDYSFLPYVIHLVGKALICVFCKKKAIYRHSTFR